MAEYIVETTETATGRYRVIADDIRDAHECFVKRPGRGLIDFDAATQLELLVFDVEVTSLRPT
jgi:hypothetical protein